MKQDVPLAHAVCLSPSQAFSDFMPETTWRQKTPFIFLLPLLVPHIKKKKKKVLCCCLNKEILFTGPHFKMFLLPFKVVKMTLLKPTILCDLHIEPGQTPLERSLQATLAPYTIVINTT